MNPPGLTAGSLLLIGALWAPQCAALSCQERGLLGLHGVLGGLSPDRPISILNNVFAKAVAAHEDHLTNPTVGALLSEPLTLDPHAWPLTRQVSIDAQIDVLRRLAGWRVGPMRQTAGDLSSVESPEPTAVQHLMDRFAAVEAAMAEALRGVSTTDRLAVIDGIPGWLDRIASDLGGDGLREPVMRVAGNIDYAALHRALGLLLEVTEPAYRERLGRELGNNRPIARPSWLSPSFQGSFLYARQTADGPVLIGGADPNAYGEPARLVIDLGGDDLYSASIDWVIDLAGNDMYLSSKDGALGAGLFSAGMILDASGNDVYAGGRVAQGAGLFGVGVLWDVSGDDIYSAQELAQGAAMFGAGLLVDLAGDDRFAGAKFNQGFGGPRGLGGLLDVAGRDLYVAGAKHTSSYGTPENYQAFSQGAGMGLRHDAGGGVGVLWDGAGDDRYLAGNFAQGMGYYLGLGLLLDDAGNDAYTGSRYAQGTAAHLAVGALIDQHGNDRYVAKTAANQGAAWDLSIAMLLDCGGDDDYLGGELALGAGEQNAIGLFYEGGGSDRYDHRAKAFGYSGAASYDGGRGAGNLGVFIDQGTGPDSYPADRAPHNNARHQRGSLGVFVDR